MATIQASSSSSAKPAVSVVICTRNPRVDLFERVLDSIDRQTLAKDAFELIVVDNGSDLPLDAATVKGNRSLQPILLNEAQPGQPHARCAGIAAAKADLLVFVDDDNFLGADYLQQALHIAESDDRIGVFGGIAEVELESPIPKWKRAFFPYLGVRNYGDKSITAFAGHWGEWEPIGAGMVTRRAVADEFVRMFHGIPEAGQLGRSGQGLLSGDDSLFARAAYRIGYSCSYQPSLKLIHYMKRSRMRLKYLVQLLEGHGRSYVLLHRAMGREIDVLKMRTALCRLLYRVWTTGRGGFITWFWDIGYAREQKRLARELNPNATLPEPSPRHSIDIMMDQPKPQVSVILCTKDPRSDLLDRTLDSLDRQMFSKSDFEVLVVDNNSMPPLIEQRLRENRTLSLRVIQETRSGHIFARGAGILAARGDLLLFVDDDNFLSPDYLEQAVRIAREEPAIGAFGGIAEPEYESRPAQWKKPLLAYLAVRNHGMVPITSSEDHWGPWEPIGAGMIVRRDVANKFMEMLQNLPGCDRLGRTKRGLMSGDDSLFSRAAHRLGYACSYQPALKLIHHIKPARFRLRYLIRLLTGHGRTYVILQSALGYPLPAKSFWSALNLIPFRVKENGMAGLIIWFWDWGYALQRRKLPDIRPNLAPLMETGARTHA